MLNQITKKHNEIIDTERKISNILKISDNLKSEFTSHPLFKEGTTFPGGIGELNLWAIVPDSAIPSEEVWFYFDSEYLGKINLLEEVEEEDEETPEETVVLEDNVPVENVEESIIATDVTVTDVTETPTTTPAKYLFVTENVETTYEEKNTIVKTYEEAGFLSGLDEERKTILAFEYAKIISFFNHLNGNYFIPNLGTYLIPSIRLVLSKESKNDKQYIFNVYDFTFFINYYYLFLEKWFTENKEKIIGATDDITANTLSILCEYYPHFIEKQTFNEYIQNIEQKNEIQDEGEH